MRIVGKTDIGMVRDTNQDAFKIVALGTGAGLALVCDGMGGARGGDTASSIAKTVITDTIREKYQEIMGADAAKTLIREAILEANHAIHQTAKEKPEFSGMGTTVVAALLHQNHAYVAHVGDSRLYMFHEGELSQLTRDHSFVQEMVDRGELSESEARVHPGKNIITRAVGVHWDVEIDVHTVELNPGDRLLLCTDGLSNLCTDEEIARVLQDLTIEEAAETLIRMANQGGGHDNITVVIVES
ncbi:MAG: Stp1/IreP family PP2C-type Ser/Thr phosphatase [Candidatus Merdivicinus sp.]